MKYCLLTTVCFVTIGWFSSCGTSIETDAEKVATLSCKIQNLVSTTRFEDSMDERIELEKEAGELEAKMKNKYTSPAEWSRFMNAYDKAFNKCSGTVARNKK
ncbi:MAG: hypothetical protein QM791_19080 [Ferruginibacter sp.]